MGHVDCLRTLLTLGVSPNPVDIDGGSPLEYAKQAGHKGQSTLLVIMPSLGLGDILFLSWPSVCLSVSVCRRMDTDWVRLKL